MSRFEQIVQLTKQVPERDRWYVKLPRLAKTEKKLVKEFTGGSIEVTNGNWFFIETITNSAGVAFKFCVIPDPRFHPFVEVRAYILNPEVRFSWRAHIFCKGELCLGHLTNASILLVRNWVALWIEGMKYFGEIKKQLA